MIKLIIFDAGGVLYTGSQEIVDEAVIKFLKKHGVYNFEKSDEIWSRIARLASIGRISSKEAYERWLEDVGLSKDLVHEWIAIDKREIWGRFKKSPRINGLLKKLKKKYVLAVLSDTQDNRQEKIEKMKIMGVEHRLFDEIFTSHDLGALKPNKKAFWQILKRFGVKPEETLFISDACDELKGAKKIGIVTTGFRCCCGDHNVERLDEICQILEELNEARVCRK